MRLDVQAVDMNRTGIGLPQPEDTFESGRLTGAVRSQQSKYLAHTHFEGDAANRFGSAVPLPQARCLRARLLKTRLFNASVLCRSITANTFPMRVSRLSAGRQSKAA